MTLLILTALCFSSSPPTATSRPSDSAYRHAYTVYGRLEAPRLTESSGLAPSRRHPGVYWTHNDSGNPATLFAIDEFGRTLGEFPVDAAHNYDWEDITLDAQNRLVIADTGDSRPAHIPQRLLLIDEPPDPRNGERLRTRRQVSFRLPEGSLDCEALFAENGHYFVIDKRGSARHASRHPATLYRIIPDDDPRRVVPGEPVERFDFDGPVTGAALSRDGKRLAVLTYSAMFVFDRTPGGPFFAGKPRVTPLMCAQAEAVCFHADGSNDLLITCEQRMLFRLSREWYESGQPFVPMARFHPPAATQEKP